MQCLPRASNDGPKVGDKLFHPFLVRLAAIELEAPKQQVLEVRVCQGSRVQDPDHVRG